MSTSFVLHDLDGTPTPAVPGLGAASVIAECTIKDLDHPGPQITHDGGWQSQRRAGTTPPGSRRRIVTKTIGLLTTLRSGRQHGKTRRRVNLARSRNASFGCILGSLPSPARFVGVAWSLQFPGGGPVSGDGNATMDVYHEAPGGGPTLIASLQILAPDEIRT